MKKIFLALALLASIGTAIAQTGITSVDNQIPADEKGNIKNTPANLKSILDAMNAVSKAKNVDPRDPSTYKAEILRRLADNDLSQDEFYNYYLPKYDQKVPKKREGK